jgi:catechol 2,3-dioxygenase-like lactoylglutathione lyase family enzyme
MSDLKLVPEIYCTNIDVTKRFYIDVFGFEVKYERPEDQFIYFTRDGVEIMVECISCEGRRWVTGKLEKPFGRGVNFQWDVVDVVKLHSHIKNVAPESIYLELESKSYQCGNRVKLQKQFIAQDPDGYLFRFCNEG